MAPTWGSTSCCRPRSCTAACRSAPGNRGSTPPRRRQPAPAPPGGQGQRQQEGGCPQQAPTRVRVLDEETGAQSIKKTTLRWLEKARAPPTWPDAPWRLEAAPRPGFLRGQASSSEPGQAPAALEWLPPLPAAAARQLLQLPRAGLQRQAWAAWPGAGRPGRQPPAPPAPPLVQARALLPWAAVKQPPWAQARPLQRLARVLQRLALRLRGEGCL